MSDSRCFMINDRVMKRKFLWMLFIIMSKTVLLFLFFVTLPFLSMAQWKSEVDKVYLDSVASYGAEGRLMNRWGWWKFPPELTKQGGAAIKRQNKVLEMCGENRGVRLYPEIEEKSFRINRHAVRCILSRMFYNIILIAQETEGGRYELFWTAIFSPFTYNYLHTRELTREEWNTFCALLDNSSIRDEGLGDTGFYNGADTWSVELYRKGKYYVKTYPFGGDLKETVLYLYSLTDFKWPQSFLLNAFEGHSPSDWRLKRNVSTWFDFELSGSFGELPQIKVRLVDGKILWCRKVGGLMHDMGSRVLSKKEWNEFLAMQDSLNTPNLLCNAFEMKDWSGSYDGCIVSFTGAIDGKTFPKREIWEGYATMQLFIRATEMSGLHIHEWEKRNWK